MRTFKPAAPLPGLFQPEFLSHVRQAEQTYARNIQGNALSFAVFKQSPWNHYGILALEQTQLALRTPYLDNDLIRAVFRAPQSALAGSQDSLRLIADGKRELLRIPTDRGIGGERGQFSGAVYHAFLEFLFKAEYAYDMGMPQSVARAGSHPFRVAPRAPVPRTAQGLSFPSLVSGYAGGIRSGNAARSPQPRETLH